MADDREVYRKDVEDLIVFQNRDLPICHCDGGTCLTPEKQIVFFGVCARNGDEEIVCDCPRFKPSS